MTSDNSDSEESYDVFIYNEDTKDAIPNNVTHVKVDPSVKEIHACAFRICELLVEVEFSEGLEKICYMAFAGCQNLKHIKKLPSTLKEIGAKHIKKLPSTLKEIGPFAFSRCESLVEVEFSEGLQVIGRGAFERCANLKHINKLPSTLKEIDNFAFNNCGSLVEVEFSEGLQVIGPGVFSECINLKHINKLPSTLKEIGNFAFGRCYILDSIQFPEGLQVVGRSAISECESLNRIKIASAHVVIEVAAFKCCKSLTSVDLPEGLQAIGEGWFKGCTSLTHVRIPSSVVRIGGSAFANCTRLISLELPEGLEMIDFHLAYADDEDHDVALRNIYGCESLVNLVIPSEQHVEQLGDDGNEFMDDIKLGTVVNNFDDLVSKLQHRFDALPVHRLCYYQSYYLLTDAMKNLRQSMDADPSAGTKVDSFGMTPFHILALAQTPNLSLFQALMKIYKVDIFHTRDKFGSTPLDYLCLNHTSDDSAMLIESLLQTIFVRRLRWLGLARWKADMLAALDVALAVDWSSRQREIGLLYFKLATYERLEAMSLLELALWRVKIDERKPVQKQENQLDEEGSSKRPRLDKSQLDGVDRQSCRINGGAEVVISNVLPFLDDVCREDYITLEI
jgi:hypothetical protein